LNFYLYLFTFALISIVVSFLDGRDERYAPTGFAAFFKKIIAFEKTGDANNVFFHILILFCLERMAQFNGKNNGKFCF
jgi:hypothetical protein